MTLLSVVARTVLYFSFISHFPLLLASTIDPNTVLKKHYLSQFIQPDHSDSISPHSEKQPRSDISLSPYQLRNALLKLIISEPSKEPNSRKVRIVSDVWHDTQVFDIPDKAHLYDMAFPGTTVLGEVYGAYTLVTGAVCDRSTLLLRQRLIHRLQKMPLSTQVIERIESLEATLSKGLSIFSKHHELYRLGKKNLFTDEQSSADQKALREGNIAGELVTSSFRIRYASLLSFLGVNAHAARQGQWATNHPEMPIRWFGPQSQVWPLSSVVYRVGSGYHQVFIPIGLLNKSKDIYDRTQQEVATNKQLTEALLALKPFLTTLFSFNTVTGYPTIHFQPDYEDRRLIELLMTKLNRLRPNTSVVFSYNLVEAAGALRCLLLLRKTIKHYLVTIARLDFYHSVAMATQDTSRWNTVAFDAGRESQAPYLVADALWNPLLPVNTAVSSNVKLGAEGHPASMIITGANATGKSTFLREVFINALFLGQTLNVAAAQSFKMRPFYYFDSLIEKRDKNGRSSNQTEVDAMLRAYSESVLLNPEQRAMIIADEVFRTTNTFDGLSGSQTLVRHFAEIPQVILLVSTHFKELTELPFQYPSLLVNKHMSVEVDPKTHSVIRMNYQLADGPSPAVNAIELFERTVGKAFPEFFDD